MTIPPSAIQVSVPTSTPSLTDGCYLYPGEVGGEDEGDWTTCLCSFWLHLLTFCSVTNGNCSLGFLLAAICLYTYILFALPPPYTNSVTSVNANIRLTVFVLCHLRGGSLEYARSDCFTSCKFMGFTQLVHVSGSCGCFLSSKLVRSTRLVRMSGKYGSLMSSELVWLIQLVHMSGNYGPWMFS